MKLTKGWDQHKLGLGILLLTIALIGGAIRLFIVLRADFPINDGGMLLQMTQDLLDKNFRLPWYTNYNHAGIPFAYPPLSFYFAALIHRISGIDLFSLFLYIPVFFNILTIPIFFFLSREVLNRENTAIHATLIYAILPPSYEWLIMGGGVARAPALMLSLAALWLAVRSFKCQSSRTLVLAAFFLGVTALCHLEIFLMSAVWIATSAFFLRRDRWGMTALASLGIGSAVIAAPWWITIIARHGLGPFQNALRSGQFSLANAIGSLLLNSMTDEFLFTPILVLGLIGLLYCVMKKDWLLPAWALGVVLFDARSLNRSMLAPLSMLASITIDDILFPAFDLKKSAETVQLRLFPNLAAAILIAYLLLRSSLLAQIYLISTAQSMDVLSLIDRQAMQWVRNNIDSDKAFLVMVPPSSWETNETAEWFPVLTNLSAINIVQGSEWLDNNAFSHMRKLYDEINACSLESLNCLEETASAFNLKYSYIYLSGKFRDFRTGAEFELPMLSELLESSNYQLIYQKDTVWIFSR